MRSIVQSRQFRRDFKRMKRRGEDVHKIFLTVGLLMRSGDLTSKMRPHKLAGEWAGFYESHLEPDWLLIYSVTDEEVCLVRTGIHADLLD